ncbi:MAG: UvrD-helicase domain-containing protein [Christensenellales bacterium]
MFIADLHIHSHFSRATSRLLVPEMLSLWGQRKGLNVIGTGDFTHPGWRAELLEKLVPAEDGLFTLRPEYRPDSSFSVPNAAELRFLLSCEISSIYKKNGRVRKVHNVLLMPGFAEAEAFSKRLEQIGNLHSDGRPILGLDSRDLLEIALECCPDVIFIPAHIWTPHFSLFGAYSGFDTLEECFEDLSGEIHALETGLSSDPAMNWRLSALDGYTLVSNSDAHSPANLAREANIFHTDLSYQNIRHALFHPGEDAFAGTLEFFPEEGKYHMDGHRACKVCLSPLQTEAHHGLCPVCGQKITLGVLHRVEALADRPEGARPPLAKPYESLIPLPEVIASTLGVGPGSKKVQNAYEQALSRLGPELHILRQAPLEDISHACNPLVAESIRRLRCGEIEMQPGYDGEYGKVKILSEEEAARYRGQLSFLPKTPEKSKAKPPKLEPQNTAKDFEKPATRPKKADNEPEKQAERPDLHYGLNDAQWQAAGSVARSIAVSAGPGTGKTRTLICRIRYLIEQCGVHPSQITAVTFTNKAAREMKQRLEESLPNPRDARSVNIGTFHALCSRLLKKWKQPVQLIDPANAKQFMAQCMKTLGITGSPRRMLECLSRQKNGSLAEDVGCPKALAALYQQKLASFSLVDFDDLLCHTLSAFSGPHKRDKNVLRMFHHLLVDEFQDINDLQYQLIRAWGAKSASVFVIGDPDQAIYGFRGANARCFERLLQDEPQTVCIHLTENYRCTPAVLYGALPVVHHPSSYLNAHKQGGDKILVCQAKDAFSQAVYIAKQINARVGGIGMLEAHRQTAASSGYGFGDFAVLYRTHHQAQILEHCLQTEGIPYTVTGRESFLDDASVRAAHAFCRLLVSPWDRLSLQLCLAALNTETETIEKIQNSAPGSLDSLCSLLQACRLDRFSQVLAELSLKAGRLKPSKAIDQWLELALQPTESLSLFRATAAMYASLPEFIQALSLGLESEITRAGGKHYTSDAVSLMTLHAAKGLEFPVVFLCGAQEGTLPLVPPTGACDWEEERRLFYVGMTRAQQSLTLLYCEKPSPFLSDLPPAYLSRETVQPAHRFSGKQLSLF